MQRITGNSSKDLFYAGSIILNFWGALVALD